MNRLSQSIRYYAPDSLIVYDLESWSWISTPSGFEDGRRVMLRQQGDSIQIEYMQSGYHYEASFSQHMLPHFIRVLAQTKRLRHSLVSVSAVWLLNMGTNEERTYQ